MKRYEYKVESIKIGRLGLFDDSGKQTKQLNVPGADGWELICISEGKKYLKYVYCREVPEGQEITETAELETTNATTPRQRLIGAIAIFCVALIFGIINMFRNMVPLVPTIAIFVVDAVFLITTIILFCFVNRSERVAKAFSIISTISTILFILSIFVPFILTSITIMHE